MFINMPLELVLSQSHIRDIYIVYLQFNFKNRLQVSFFPDLKLFHPPTLIHQSNSFTLSLSPRRTDPQTCLQSCATTSARKVLLLELGNGARRVEGGVARPNLLSGRVAIALSDWPVGQAPSSLAGYRTHWCRPSISSRPSPN